MQESEPAREHGGFYDAFISYSHDDIQIAERLSKRIRRYMPPRGARVGRKRLQVFRDVERLTASADLSSELVRHLQKSKQLILLSSPSAARSPYVNAEVQEFVKLNGIDSVWFVLCRGEFHESLPRCIKDLVNEPLYIDLRDSDRKTFNLESLRLIAALLGVNYAELRMEDEIARRRTRTTAFTSAFILLFIIFSMFLVISAEPEGWARIPQDNPALEVMPVHEIAINRDDPDVILYNGYNARWGMNPPPEGVDYFPETANYGFESTIDDFIRGQTGITPVAKIQFELPNGSGSGEIVIYGIAEYNNGLIRYARSLEFQGKTDTGEPVDLLIEPTITTSDYNDPFNLSPWPVEILVSNGVMEEGESIEATIYYYTEDTEINTTFYPFYKDEGFWEWAVQFGPKNVVFSNVEEEELVVLGEKLIDIENEDDLWNRILESEAWITYEPLVREEIGVIPFWQAENQGEIVSLVNGIPNISERGQLVELLDPNVLEAEYNFFTLISNSAFGVHISILEIIGQFDSIELPADLPPKWVFRNSALPGWWRLSLPTDEPKTKIVDVKPLSADGLKILLVTEDGIFRTIDGGKNWSDVSFGENAFSAGQNVKMIVVGDEPKIYALVNKNIDFDDGENQLFEYVNRNIPDRWKLGLIQILQ